MNVWLLFAGLGFFLLGMRELENGLSGLGRRRLRELLHQHTDTPIRGVLLGTVATAVLQSSSLLSLIVQAFAGASLLSLSGAMALIIGSNLGTTFTGWVIATLGFKLNFAVISYALIGSGALGLSLSAEGRWQLLFRIITGLGLLILGLNEMKDSVSAPSAQVDFTTLGEMPVWIYFLAGIVIASIIQSSSATIGITLAALHTGVIDLMSAGALVIGADLGTTTTVLLGAMGGASIKKQIAAGQIVFNLFNNIVALFLLLPFLPAAMVFFEINDQLYGLVLFHSVFNLLGVAVFLPFITLYADTLSKYFITTKNGFSLQVHQVNPAVTEAALKAARMDIEELLQKLTRYALIILTDKEQDAGGEQSLYLELKARESELLAYFQKIHAEKLAPDDAQQLDAMQQASREAILAAKALKDVHHHILFLLENDEKNEYYLELRQCLLTLIGRIDERNADGSWVSSKWLTAREQELRAVEDGLSQKIYQDKNIKDISSTLNLMRELEEFGHCLISSRKLVIAFNSINHNSLN